MRDYKHHTSRPQGDKGDRHPPHAPHLRPSPRRPAPHAQWEAPRPGRAPSLGLWIAVAVGAVVLISVFIHAVLVRRHAMLFSSPAPVASARSVVPARPQAATRSSIPAVSAAPVRSTAPAASTASATAATVSSDDFSFYQILPHMQVQVPTDILGTGPGMPGAAAKRRENQRVVIQVGAFAGPAEAQDLRARLALQGIQTVMQKVDVPGHGVLYRLRTQPFDTLEAVQEALRKIKAQGLQPMLIPGTAPTASAATAGQPPRSKSGPAP